MHDDAGEATLIALARGVRARVGAAEGAAVRDGTGRSYAGATVAVGSLRLSALQLAVAQAAGAGATGLEAAAVVTDAPDVDITVVRDLGGPGVGVTVCGPDGAVRARLVT